MSAAVVLLGLVWGGFFSARTLPAPDARDARFKEAWLNFLREKAPDNPEAASTLAFWQDHPWGRVHLASQEQMRRLREPFRQNGRGFYLPAQGAIVIAWFPWRTFVDSAGELLPEVQLRPQLESAAGAFVHETAHFRTDADLRFFPTGTLQSEILAFGHERRYLRRALVLTPDLARAGRARLAGRPPDPDYEAARKKYGDETVFNAMLAVAAPLELCRAVSRRDWYGEFDADVDSSSAPARIKFAADPKRLAAARAYFQAQMPELAGCFTGS